MKILFASAEVVPFAKSGGLADVAGSLPQYLNQDGNETRVVMPKYGTIADKYKERMEFICSFNVDLSWRHQYCGVSKLEENGVTYYFIDNEYYFNRPNLYGYDDDPERFSFFSKAVLEMLLHVHDFMPDVIHCNDWHTGLIPMLKKEVYHFDSRIDRIKTVYSIHNLKYQGYFDRFVASDILGLNKSAYAMYCLDKDGGINFMKAGIVAANKVTTVSPTYSGEITTSFFGEGLENIINSRRADLVGILNGIETKDYNFHTLKGDLSIKKIRDFKRAAKKELYARFEMEYTACPVYSIITRFVEQKGIDLILGVIHEMMELDARFVFLGTGDEKYEKALQALKDQYPDKIMLYIGFSSELADLIYKASDFFLMPSLFEPCGLSQMISMQAGTLPIVRETGGLADSVIPFNQYTGDGTGFSFANYNAHELLHQIETAAWVYMQKDVMEKLIKNAVSADFSWNKSKDDYLAIYYSIMD